MKRSSFSGNFEQLGDRAGVDPWKSRLRKNTNSQYRRFKVQELIAEVYGILTIRLHFYHKPVARPIFQAWQIFTGRITWHKI